MLGSSRGLERLQLTIGFIAAQFGALAGIVVIQVFTKVLDEAVPNILPRDHLAGIVESIVTSHKVVMIPLEDLLSQ